MKKRVFLVVLATLWSQIGAMDAGFEIIENHGVQDIVKGAFLQEGQKLAKEGTKDLKKLGINTADKIFKENKYAHGACVEAIVLGSDPLSYWGYGFNRVASHYNLKYMPTLALERLRRAYAECVCNQAATTGLAVSAVYTTGNPGPLIPIALNCGFQTLKAASTEMALWAAGIRWLYSKGKRKIFGSKPKPEVIEEVIETPGTDEIVVDAA